MSAEEDFEDYLHRFSRGEFSWEELDREVERRRDDLTLEQKGAVYQAAMSRHEHDMNRNIEEHRDVLEEINRDFEAIGGILLEMQDDMDSMHGRLWNVAQDVSKMRERQEKRRRRTRRGVIGGIVGIGAGGLDYFNVFDQDEDYRGGWSPFNNKHDFDLWGLLEEDARPGPRLNGKKGNGKHTPTDTPPANGGTSTATRTEEPPETETSTATETEVYADCVEDPVAFMTNVNNTIRKRKDQADRKSRRWADVFTGVNRDDIILDSGDEFYGGDLLVYDADRGLSRLDRDDEYEKIIDGSFEVLDPETGNTLNLNLAARKGEEIRKSDVEDLGEFYGKLMHEYSVAEESDVGRSKAEEMSFDEIKDCLEVEKDEAERENKARIERSIDDTIEDVERAEEFFRNRIKHYRDSRGMFEQIADRADFPVEFNEGPQLETKTWLVNRQLLLDIYWEDKEERYDRSVHQMDHEHSYWMRDDIFYDAIDQVDALNNVDEDLLFDADTEWPGDITYMVVQAEVDEDHASRNFDLYDASVNLHWARPNQNETADVGSWTGWENVNESYAERMFPFHRLEKVENDYVASNP